MEWSEPKSRESLLKNKRKAIDRLSRIWEISEDYQRHQLGHDSKNDFEHCYEVDKHIRKILTNARISSTSADYFILSVTAAYHDLDKAVAEAKLKKKHGYYSGKIVGKEPESYGLTKVEAEAFSYLSTYHYKGRFKDEPPFAIRLPDFPRTPIKPRKLALVFFLADRLDIGYSRADDLFLKARYPEGNIPGKALARNTIEKLVIHDDTDEIVVKLRDISTLSPSEKRRIVQR